MSDNELYEIRDLMGIWEFLPSLFYVKLKLEN